MCFFFGLSVEFPIWVCIVDKPEPTTTTTTETYKFNEKAPKEKQTQNTESAQKF